MNERNDTDIATIRKRHEAAERGPASAVIGAHHDRGTLLAEVQRCEAERAQLADENAVLSKRLALVAFAREEERKAWVRFTAATVQVTLAQMALMVGPVQETVELHRRADAESEAAIEALAALGVDVVAYLEAGDERA